MPILWRAPRCPNWTGLFRSRDSRRAVKVTRDSHGVPTIEAATLEDLFFAQGYVTAQDRLWQMDVMRRFGGGELSEILGKTRSKSIANNAFWDCARPRRNRLQMASPRDRSYFEAYARGVNAFIDRPCQRQFQSSFAS